MNVPQRVVLDLDSREIPVNAEQEHSGLKRALRVHLLLPPCCCSMGKETAAFPGLFSFAMRREFTVKHRNQGLTICRWLGICSAHDISGGQRLAVQTVVCVIVRLYA
jgi:hypothetical protein